MSSGLPNLAAPQLLADVGGTNARFAILLNGVISNVQVLDGAKYPTIDDAARAYLKQIDVTPLAAAISIAAPLIGDEVRMTNHPWQFSIVALRRKLNLDRLIVLNDFTALAMALRYLPSEELKQLGGNNAAPNSAIALIGPGTGLGVSGLVPLRTAKDTAWVPLQGEGGHVTLAPCSQREAAVIDVLHERFGHVSAERTISGPGLVNLYDALCVLDRISPRNLQPSEVTHLALENLDPQCIEALKMFCALLGTVAGDLALTLGAVGGVYIGGGIVSRLGGYFLNSEFRSRFESKGRYRDYLAAIPVFVIESATPAFYGLARSFVDAGPRIEDVK